MKMNKNKILVVFNDAITKAVDKGTIKYSHLKITLLKNSCGYIDVPDIDFLTFVREDEALDKKLNTIFEILQEGLVYSTDAKLDKIGILEKFQAHDKIDFKMLDLDSIKLNKELKLKNNYINSLKKSIEHHKMVLRQNKIEYDEYEDEKI